MIKWQVEERMYQLSSEEWTALHNASGVFTTKKAAGDFARSMGWQRGDAKKIAGPMWFVTWAVAQPSQLGDANTLRFRTPSGVIEYPVEN